MIARDARLCAGSRTPACSDDRPNGILLDAGTNEVEILVFRLGDQRYGVNVAKVREVHHVEHTTFLPRFPEAVDGVIRIRDAVVPAVDLHKCLWKTPSPAKRLDDRHLLLEFNARLVAFRVGAVDRVHRMSWQAILPVPPGVGPNVPMTGITLLGDSIVLILDFENIGVKLGLSGGMRYSQESAALASPEVARCPLVVADDSAVIRGMLRAALSEAGYENVKLFQDGQEAWEYLEEVACQSATGSVHRSVGAVITDIEMPRMDGFRLTREIRSHEKLKDLPVVLFSSLVSEDNEKKGKQVGATAQISKPCYHELSSTLLTVLENVISSADSRPVQSVPLSTATS